jgi:hypothetical protein
MFASFCGEFSWLNFSLIEIPKGNGNVFLSGIYSALNSTPPRPPPEVDDDNLRQMERIVKRNFTSKTFDLFVL